MPLNRAENEAESANRLPNETALWRVQLLGGLRVTPLANGGDVQTDTDGAFSHFRTHKTALLLARLLLYPNRSHSRDELADWLWPDLPADRGRANLSQTLLRLRKPFAEDGNSSRASALFQSDHQTICVRAQAFQTDVACFEQLVRDARARGAQNAPSRERAALWEAALLEYGNGELLPGFYDDWINNERSRLNTLWQGAQEDWRVACGQAAAVAAEAAHSPTPSSPQKEEAAPVAGLPLTLTRFFGRQSDIARLEHLLNQNAPARLITLVGTGGIGKTRLAVEAARRVSDSNTAFGRVFFASLADVTDAARVPATLVQYLNLDADSEEAAADPLLPLIQFLRNSTAENQPANARVLLVLDNLEQLGSACAPLVIRLLAQVPHLHILATSRQPVGIAGEQEVFVGPLLHRVNPPKEARNDAPDETNEADDVRLFVDRARLMRPEFALTPKTAKEVRELCALLEGVPLAIELAAAWARALSPAQITARLHNRFDTLRLRGIAGDSVPKRHQSLHAAIAWSYDLLPPSLQTFWAQLSIFRGGWTVEAAQFVTGIRDAAEPLLLLMERSLLLAETEASTGETRYRMLESLREFAQEQAVQNGLWDAVCFRHAQYFEQLSYKANALIEAGRGMQHARILLGSERDNVRVALAHALKTTEPKSREIGIRLALQSQWLWLVSEGRDRLQEAAEALPLLPGDTARPLQASLLAMQSLHALHKGDLATAANQLRESLALWELLGNEEEANSTRSRLASVARRSGDPASAFAEWKQCLQYAQKTNNRHREAAMLNNLANVGPDLAQCRAWGEQAVAIDRMVAPGSNLLACSLNTLGGVALKQKDFAAARTVLEEAHAIAVADGAAGMSGVAKITLAECYLAAGERLERAEELLHEAQSIFEENAEHPRLAEAYFVQFHVALKRGDAGMALDNALAYFRLNREAALQPVSPYAATVPEAASQMEEAGFPFQANQLIEKLAFLPHG